jgi:hypothetical protein
VADMHLDENEQYTRIGVLMDKVGFDRIDQPVETLSGGWIPICRSMTCTRLKSSTASGSLHRPTRRC